MKNITFQIGIISSLIIITLGVLYYFTFFLPHFQNEELERKTAQVNLDRQIECQKNGMNLNNREMAGIEGALVPVFKFSSKLNTCLYKGGSTRFDADNGPSFSGFIKDVYSNKEIVSYVSFTKNGKTEDLVVGGLVSRAEFERQEKELFNE